MKYIIAFLLAGGSVQAETCPPAPDHSARLAEIIVQLNTVPNASAARPLSQELWTLWTDAPDRKAQELLDRGMRQREEQNLLAARDTLDALVAYCPDYAEGYNQRAFANFLRRDFSAALADLNMTLTLVPNHVAAMSGKSLTLMGLGRTDAAQETLRSALALNPWLAERSLLQAPEGEEI